MTAAGMVSGTSANGVTNTVANSVLPVDDEPSLRRWLFAAVAVVLVHAAIVFWILVRSRLPVGRRAAVGGNDRARASGCRAAKRDASRRDAGTANDGGGARSG